MFVLNLGPIDGKVYTVPLSYGKVGKGGVGSKSGCSGLRAWQMLGAK